jgi:division protein CdvB (Snf7/Vps24/ESCRT-III family)
LSLYIKRDEHELDTLKLRNKIDSLNSKLEELEKKLQEQIVEKEHQYIKAVEVINQKVKEEIKPLFDDVHIILKAKARDRADDILRK